MKTIDIDAEWNESWKTVMEQIKTIEVKSKTPNVFLVLLLMTATILWSCFMHGWVLSILWSWFVVEQFSLEQLSLGQAAGLVVIVKLVTWSASPADQLVLKTWTIWELMAKTVFLATFMPLTFLAGGWLVKVVLM